MPASSVACCSQNLIPPLSNTTASPGCMRLSIATASMTAAASDVPSSPNGMIVPLRPGSISSTTPPASVAITQTFRAIASRTVSPKLSFHCVGKRSTSMPAKKASIVSVV